MSTARPARTKRTPRCVPIADLSHDERPLIKIAAKPAPWQSLPKPGQRRLEMPKHKVGHTCRVPRCTIRNCRLQTHRDWKPPPASSGTTTPQHAGDEVNDAQPAAPAEAQELYELAILRGGAEGLPYLPLAALRKPVFRGLFHRFCLEVWDKIGILIAPPARSADEANQKKMLKSKLLSEAMDAPAYLLNFIVAAYLYLMLRDDPLTVPKDLFHLQMELVKHLRQKLDDFNNKDVDQLIRVVLTLVILEATCGKNHFNLMSHRQAMIHLVESRGGLHNLGPTIPYVMNMDRIVSLYTDQFPVYCSWIDPTFGLQRASRHPRTYGGFFEDKGRAKRIDSDIRWYCSAVCRALEILEGEDWYFSPGQIRDSSELWYFYFLRDQIVCNFTHLNARFCHENTVDRCMLLAAKLVEYTVLMDTFMVTLPLFIADKLQNLLCHQDLGEQWHQMSDVLRWVLWVLIVYPVRWTGRTWALRLAKERLDLEYGTTWAASWTNLEFLNVRRFVWCSRRADRDYLRACNELWKLSVGTDSQAELPQAGTHSSSIQEM